MVQLVDTMPMLEPLTVRGFEGHWPIGGDNLKWELLPPKKLRDDDSYRLTAYKHDPEYDYGIRTDNWPETSVLNHQITTAYSERSHVQFQLFGLWLRCCVFPISKQYYEHADAEQRRIRLGMAYIAWIVLTDRSCTRPSSLASSHRRDDHSIRPGCCGNHCVDKFW
jgi:hypothetical protein